MWQPGRLFDERHVDGLRAAIAVLGLEQDLLPLLEVRYPFDNIWICVW